MNDVEKAVYDTITPLIADHDNTYEGCKDIVRAAVKAAIAALADELDEAALEIAAQVYLKSHWQAMNEASGHDPLALAIKAYLAALKDSK